MSRYAARTDQNHKEVTQALRSCGWTVIDTSRVGHGFPDLLAFQRGAVRFIEVKDGTLPPSRRVLTTDERAFHAAMAAAGVDVVIVESIDQVASL